MNDPIVPADVYAQVVQVRAALGWMTFLIALVFAAITAALGACLVILRKVYRILTLVETHGGIGDRAVQAATREVTAEVRRVGESVKAEAASVAAAVAAHVVPNSINTPEPFPRPKLPDDTGEHKPLPAV